MNGHSSQDYGSNNWGNSLNVTAAVPAGTSIQLSLVDSNDNEAWSGVVSLPLPTPVLFLKISFCRSLSREVTTPAASVLHPRPVPPQPPPVPHRRLPALR